MLCPGNGDTKPFEFREDGVGGCRPHEGTGMDVVVVDEGLDPRYQFPDVAKRSAPVVSANSIRGSRRGPMVVLEQAAEPLASLDLTVALHRQPAGNLVSQPLVTPLVVVVRRVLSNGLR